MKTKLTRREFLNIFNKIVAATGLAVVLGPVVAYFYPPKLEETPSEPVLVAPEIELPVGSSKTVKFGRYPAIIIHTETGLKAYSAVCTHFACIVAWKPEINQIACPCHEGFFNPEDGSVISGPPPTPLEHINVEIIDGDIYVSAGGEV
jgi:cytochrome b6-f complex iron-sulfur subunit